jgi:hypothetical protein
MPGFDGTGPQGRGPLTGGGRGYCAVGWGGTLRRGFGLRGRPRGGSLGYGGRWWRGVEPSYGVGPVNVADVDDLSEQIRILSERVEDLSARLERNEGGSG